LRAALEGVADLPVDDVAFVGLAKRFEELWRPDERRPVVLPRGSEALFLVQRVRDEAHRFAITYQRQRRTRTVASSELDTVPGIGPTRRQALLQRFGSVAAIRRASIDELAGVPGLSRTLATVVQQHLAGDDGRAARPTGRRPTPCRRPPRDRHRGSTPGRRRLRVPSRRPRILIITGMSGAGRTTAADVIEDLGWFVIDNLPPTLIGRVSDLAFAPGSSVTKLGVVADVRGREFFAALVDTIRELRRSESDLRVVFLEADDDTLVRRFGETRRRHPAAPDAGVLTGIRRERQQLEELRGLADLIIDTTDLNVHELRARVSRVLEEEAARCGSTCVVRVQARQPAGGRPAVRRPVPAEPALGRGAAAAHRPGRGGPTTSSGQPRPARSSRPSSTSSTSWCRATCRRASAT
jgi:hypothetical protein